MYIKVIVRSLILVVELSTILKIIFYRRNNHKHLKVVKEGKNKVFIPIVYCLKYTIPYPSLL